MQTPRFVKLSLIGLLPMFGAACSSFDNYSAEFEEAWASSPATMTADRDAQNRVELKALSEEQANQLKTELDSLDPESDCKRIETISLRLTSAEITSSSAIAKAAECDYRTGDYASARTRYQQLVELEDTAEAHARLGLTYLQGGDVTRAEAALLTAVQRQPDLDWRVQNGLGYIQDQAGQWSDAETYYQRASQLAPESGVPLNNLGMSYLRQERYPDAINAFSSALNRSPDLHVARLNLRTAFSMTGDLAMAYSGASDSERAAILNNTGVAALANGNSEEARTLFSQALKQSPVFYVNAYNNLQRAQLIAKADFDRSQAEEMRVEP